MNKQCPAPDALYVYVLVRKDLTFSQQAVQAAHAAMIAARHLLPLEATDTPNLVLLGVPDGNALQTAHEALVRARVPCCPYFEPDLNDELTAVATGPLQGGARRALLGYKLL